MILHTALGSTIIAVHQSLRILVLRRHRLTLDRLVKLAKLHLHIDDASTADRTLVRGLHVGVVASQVDTVATLHENHGQRRREHIVSANWTVAVCGTFDATMRVSD